MLNSDPLMFIETVTTKGLPQGRTVYDSRYDTIKKEKPLLDDKQEEVEEVVINKEVDVEILNKLDSVVDLYQIAKPVICDIITVSQHFEGIPFYKDDEKLLIKQNGEDVSINLQEIQEVLILRI